MPFPTGMQYQNPVEPMQVDLPEAESNVNLNFTVESPTLDLDSYASQYKGYTKLQRLMFIAAHCPSLAFDALRIAASAVKATHQVDLYKDVMNKLNNIRENSPHLMPEGQVEDLQPDTQWIETTAKRAQVKLDKLDVDLKNYKNNSIKESIRRGHDDLGDHYLDCGDLGNALKCYSRARDYCISAKHIISMCLNVIKVSVFMGTWGHVQTFVNKAELVPDLSEQKEKSSSLMVLTKLNCVAGLAELARGQYKATARLLLKASFDHCDYDDVISAHDVATYGGLCALATFDRDELHQKVLTSSSFKLFLELEPQLRDILHKFYDTKYAACLKLLADIKDNLMLDIYLVPHVEKLYTMIRNRALVQYFSPYVSADLRQMAVAFNTTVPALEDELTELILNGDISGRIDSEKKIVYARDIDARCRTFEKVLELGKAYERRTKALVLRTVVVQHQVHVKVSGRDEDATQR